MEQQQDLFGKTFDQQMDITGGNLAGIDIGPNTVIPGEIVLEPLPTGIRVTGRDSNHRTLWGFVASEGMLRQVHCLIAVYDTLQARLGTELAKMGLASPQQGDPVECAQKALNELAETADLLRKSIAVKKVSEATCKRAELIRSVVTDANRMISLVVKSVHAQSSFEDGSACSDQE